MLGLYSNVLSSSAATALLQSIPAEMCLIVRIHHPPDWSIEEITAFLKSVSNLTRSLVLLDYQLRECCQVEPDDKQSPTPICQTSSHKKILLNHGLLRIPQWHLTKLGLILRPPPRNLRRCAAENDSWAYCGLDCS